MHEHYMASGTHCPIYHKFMFTVAVDGAAAPKGSMTYDSTQGNFLRVSGSLSLQVSVPPRGSEVGPGGSEVGSGGSEVGPGGLRWAQLRGV